MSTKTKKESRQTITIQEDIYERARALAYSKGRRLKEWANEILLMEVEKDEFLKRYAPNLSLINITETSLLIRDTKLSRTAEIIIKDCELVCLLEQDEKKAKDCIHTRFALALPEVGKLNLNLKNRSESKANPHQLSE